MSLEGELEGKFLPGYQINLTNYPKIPGSKVIIEAIEKSSAESKRYIECFLNSIDDTNEAFVKIRYFNQVEDIPIIMKRFDSIDEGASFVKQLELPEIKDLQKSKSMEQAVLNPSFYRSYKKFKNGIPLSTRLDTPVDYNKVVDIPDTVKSHPNKELANREFTLDNGAKVLFNKQGFPIFESNFTVQISDPMFLKVERATHFSICNDALKEAIKTDSVLKSLFTDIDIAKIKDGILPSNFI